MWLAPNRLSEGRTDGCIGWKARAWRGTRLPAADCDNPATVDVVAGAQL